MVLCFGRLFTTAFALLGLIASMNTPARSTPTFEHLVVLGDSLSDTGNAGRFSNGPVWVEYLAGRLGLQLSPSQRGGSNFAVGGARLDPRSGPHSLRAQVDEFLWRPKPNGRILVIVYGGGNDLLAAVGHPHGPMMVDVAASVLRSIVADLIAHGASDILVPNLPDVGITPEVQSRSAEPSWRLGRSPAASTREHAKSWGADEVRLTSGLTGRGWAGAETGVAGEARCRATARRDDRDRGCSH
jgi:phospholipase/lecithinase/hemolysin